MKIYIWERIDQLTGEYHSQGGAVVVAESKERAKALLEGYQDQHDKEYNRGPYAKLTEEEYASAVEIDMKSNKEAVFIFPDAGCC